MADKKGIMTVLGRIDADDLGVTMMHEHVLCRFDWDGLWPELSPFPEYVDDEVQIANLGVLRRDIYALRDNCSLSNIDLAVEELGFYQGAGGTSLVELSPIGLNRDPAGLREVSKKSGVNIVAGCGWYVNASHPSYVDDETISRLTERIESDVTAGMEGTDVKAGIIGEIGVTGPMHPREEKCLRAALRAQKSTGLAVNVHFGSRNRGAEVLQVMGIAKEEMVDPDRVIFSHMDQHINPEYYLRAADEGYYIEFDCFGHEQYTERSVFSDKTFRVEPRDTDRISALVKILDSGFIDKVLLSQDVFVKTNLRAYGGWGYDHILTNVVPMLNRIGVTEDQIHTMMVANPREVLAV